MEQSSLLRTDKEITEIYYRNAQSVFRMALMYLGSYTDAEDIVQNVFVKFIDREPVFADENHEKAWFITVTKNICKNMLKSFWKSRQEDIEGIELPVHVDRYGEESHILGEIKKLKTNYRVTLYLYYYEEFSIKEIADIMGRKESTIQTWLARGREKLRIELGGGGVYEA